MRQRLCQGSLGTIRTHSPGLTLCFLLFLPCPPQLLLAFFPSCSQSCPPEPEAATGSRRRLARFGASGREHVRPSAPPAFPAPTYQWSAVGLPDIHPHYPGGTIYSSCGGTQKGGGRGARARPHGGKSRRGARTSVPHACPARVLSTPKLRGEMARILAPLSDLLATRVLSPRPGSRRKRLVRWPQECCALGGPWGSQSASLPAAGSAPFPF